MRLPFEPADRSTSSYVFSAGSPNQIPIRRHSVLPWRRRFHGHLGRNPISPPSVQPSPAAQPVIRAMRTMQGKVGCNASDKTVAVEVLRLSPHPKYKRRVRKKKTFQAHDPLNQFQVGDFVQLEKGSPISKTKTFWAVPVPGRSGSKYGAEVPQELGVQLESES